MPELETKPMLQSKKERLKAVTEKFLNEITESQNVPMMFRAMVPTCRSLAISSVDKLTEDQTEHFIIEARKLLDYVDGVDA